MDSRIATHAPTRSMCALALGLLFIAGSAHATSPILSISPVVTSSSNLGGSTTTYGPDITTVQNTVTSNDHWSSATHSDTEIHLAPTTESSGIAYEYEVTTTTHTWDQTTSKQDWLYISVSSAGDNKSGNKWIQLTGSVESTIDTYLAFSLFASGAFDPITTPFGSAAPLLASFYFGSETPTALSATTATSLIDSTYSTYSSMYDTTTFNLTAGVSQNFVAYVYAPDAVSIGNFTLSAHTGYYDFELQHMSNTQDERAFIDAHLISPIPEPENYALIAIGSILVGTMTRRQNAMRL